MSNALQNILLQELEDFSGIFVATTNLIDNIDPAFDRRFLFKQQLSNPDQQTRLQILQHQFPTFPNSDLDFIAQEYDLTGSQIQSIKKKVFVDQLLDLTETTSRNLEQYAKSEISFRRTFSKMGFR
jgi:SpoVK/Ycf46/Vps4 family AAA+-type ATPase